MFIIAFLTTSMGFAGSTFLGGIGASLTEGYSCGLSSSCFFGYSEMADFSSAAFGKEVSFGGGVVVESTFAVGLTLGAS
jgi:hypothetical protein